MREIKSAKKIKVDRNKTADSFSAGSTDHIQTPKKKHEGDFTTTSDKDENLHQPMAFVHVHQSTRQNQRDKLRQSLLNPQLNKKQNQTTTNFQPIRPNHIPLISVVTQSGSLMTPRTNTSQGHTSMGFQNSLD